MDLHILANIASFDWPAGTGDHLLKVLQDPDAPEDERLLAADLAGDLVVMNDVLAQELLRILEDTGQADRLREQAAASLGPALEEGEIFGFEVPDELNVSEEVLVRAKSLLRKLHRDPEAPKDLRRRALEASARAPEDWHSGAVRAAYYDGDRDWKLSAVFCMRFIPGFDAEIVEALDTDDVDILFEAILAAGNHGVDGAWPHVRNLVQSAASGEPILPDDPDGAWSLLLAAIEAVVSIRPQEAAGALSGLLESGDEELEDAALDALEMLGLIPDADEILDDDEIWDEDGEDEDGEDEETTWH